MAHLFIYGGPCDGIQMRGVAMLLLILGTLIDASPPIIPIQMSIQYTTDGEVTLNIMNIPFQTVQLHVTLLGCDYGYYDEYLITPPRLPSSITPFHCVECTCENFEFDRVEPFIATSTT